MLKMNDNRDRLISRKTLLEALLAGCFTMLIIWLLYYLKGYAPFGDNSLATMDANIQYLDFFAYFKDVLAGENSLSYTFGKVLGGTNVANYSYYLSSPFSLLVIFFDKTNLVSFFDILVSIKLAVAAITASLFLNIRFRKERDNSLFHSAVIAILSVSYALCQYSIAQSSNIMWLDGVYMLPLILLGVYLLVQEKKFVPLSVFVGCAILFNWYSAGIDCLFSILWFCFELVYLNIEKCNQNSMSRQYLIKEGFMSLARYIGSMAVGVMLSCILFLPTYAAMEKSSRGTLEFDLITDFSFIGNLFSAAENYVLGSKSALGSVSLFCGSVALIGCIACVTRKWKDKKKQILAVSLLLISILLFYWQPFYGLFSLLKSVGSYWYRYSYVGIFSIVFLAAWFYLTEEKETLGIRAVKSAGLFAALLLLLNYVSGEQDTKKTYITAIFMLVIAIAIAIVIYLQSSERSHRLRKKLSVIALCAVFMLETGYSVKLQMDNYHVSNATTFKEYAAAAIEQTDALEEYDSTTYRITQTYTRKWGDNNLTANFNEALAYNYWSISGYTSSPDDITRSFLEDVGYRTNGANMNIVETSILAADSLMGVKYVLSNYEINGLVLVDSIDENGNGVSVYENPYYLPMAFTYNGSDYSASDTSNPFEYQNELYSELMGEYTELYSVLDYTVEELDDGSLLYTIIIPDGDYAIYGNLPWDSQFDAVLDVNESYETAYARWLSPSVFYIPTSDGDGTCTVLVSSDNTINLKEDQEQFYALDLNCLGEVTSQIRANEADSITIENGYASITVDAQDGENLYISIPYDSGWTITVNGVGIEAALFADCMYSITLTEGTNVVEMTYHVQYQGLGLAVTVVGVLILVGIVFLKRRRRAK